MVKASDEEHQGPSPDFELIYPSSINLVPWIWRKGLFRVSFPYFEQLAAIYGKDIATGENAEGFGEAVGNLEKEIAMEEEENEEEDMISIGTTRRSIDTCSIDTTSFKRQKKEPRPKRATGPSDPFAAMLQDVNNQLNSVTQHVGTMATTFSAVMARETTQEDPQQKSREKAISELSRLAFTGSEIVDAATIFAKTPEHMNMMLVLPEILRRDFVLKMLPDGRKKQG
ncbi:hypothetical protein ZWY2020_049919 [Hordeum vulgare]|nr:hypothetical protein ZWY2020_049919 [Hordeum vulgare]